MKVRLTRTKKPKTPDLRVDGRVWDGIANIAIGDMLERIDRQQTPDGRRIKRNAPSTRERKRRRGRPQLSLHDTGKRFHSASGYKVTHLPRGRGVIVAPKDRTVAGYVIEKGYRWIGMSKQAWAGVRAILRAAIRESIKRARR